MTKEEYENLLTSDYWKGYSYSLIKERNFTCQDCGRSFPGERNKLQVHHLVYRDIMPWSYRPEEVVVLCIACHQKRHGIVPTEETTETNTGLERKPIGFQTGNFESAVSSTDSQSHSTSATSPAENNGVHPERSAAIIEEMKKKHTDFSESHYNREEWSKPSSNKYDQHSEHESKIIKYAVAVCLILFLSFSGFKHLSHRSDSVITVEDKVELDEKVEVSKEEDKQSTSTVKKKDTQSRPGSKVGNDVDKSVEMIPEIKTSDVTIPNHETAITSELNDNSVVTPNTEEKRDEKSLSEILDERVHANAVKRAQEVGVSTEGSTSEILERITHANTVKRAQEVGVSTEGTTSDILERITHANTVKRAQEAGVSTEGSTSEILERITKKQLEKYNY